MLLIINDYILDINYRIADIIFAIVLLKQKSIFEFCILLSPKKYNSDKRGKYKGKKNSIVVHRNCLAINEKIETQNKTEYLLLIVMFDQSLALFHSVSVSMALILCQFNPN